MLHAVATRADVGIPKAECLKKHFSLIFPECQVDAKVLLYDVSSEEEILSGNPDFVLDCIDNIDTKVALLAACVHGGLKVLSATGAGARADPTRIHVADLRESTNDPLSRVVRHRLRKDHAIEGGIPVVFSLEKPKAKLLPFRGPSGKEDNPSNYQVRMLAYYFCSLKFDHLKSSSGEIASAILQQKLEFKIHLDGAKAVFLLER
ncbi:tRNA threonylcarbamoyladenosine dehydratase 2-like [Hibiscus syriacus]|uniref:tRNA threonylcarbamoyladenosine dehydratase 2-like n=1 Tax=Hibiscus syriacus TaxID=106335 RepID=UPI0019233462|nr:tRNA threonylcarbamoyladenosine dehydratase 2-like [Hibiscus syriacus]